MFLHKVGIGLAFVSCLHGCALVHRDSQLRSIDRIAARSVSDQVLEDVTQRRNNILYNKMEKTFRVATSRDDFEMALGLLLDQYGVPLSFDYEREIESVEIFGSGEMRRLLKLYYAVETTKYPKGSYYMSVDIVSEGDGLAVSGVYFNKPL